MKRDLLLTGASMLLFAGAASAQIAFSNANSRLTVQTNSGCTTTVIDWNNDGLDDIVRLDQGYILIVEEQKPGNQFVSHNYGAIGDGSGWAWGMAVGDVDNNGYKDVIAGGYDPTFQFRVAKFNATGTSITTTNFNPGAFFVQNVTLGDINDDGFLDVFACDDNAESHVYLNNGTGSFTSSSIINFNVTATDDSGNYGSVWSDYDNDGDLDLYIAKCRQAISNPADGRRINVMFRNNGDGTFTEAAAASNINVGWQSWTASFGDIDNDDDFDLLLTNHDHETQVFENDGSGVYTELTTTGISTVGMTPIQSVWADFDNDGWIDLLISGSQHKLYRNNGNKTFSLVSGLFDANDMESYSVGDLNHDGFIDVYASYANIYTTPTNIDDVLWLNNRNNNHYIGFDLHGTTTNDGAVGARVTIHGPWGSQTREVRVGESYGTVNSSQIHFGIGSTTTVTSAEIYWPTSGITQTINNPVADQYHTVIEQTCVSPDATITSSNGTYSICAGNSVTLSAPAGHSYEWSTGATTQSIVASAAGEYTVRVIAAGNACEAVNTVVIVENPDETPSVSVSGPTEICQGSSVTLTSSAHPNGYTWSSTESTQSITVTQAGTYSVTVNGACQNYTSSPITITVYDATEPVSNDVTLGAPGSANLSATGTDVTWYSDAAGTTVVGTGNNYTTPVVSTTTTYYVANTENFGAATANGGKNHVTGTNVYSGNTTNALMYFDVMEACTLNTVKVYTDTPGERLIELRNSAGTLVNSALVNITGDSMVVTLNFALTPGTDYSLGTNTAQNQVFWGNNGPRLKRNNGDVTYPYNVSTFVSLTGNNQGQTLYYYFYDWNISVPGTDCQSDLVPVTVNIANGVEEAEAAGFSIYPNPANNVLNIDQKNGGAFSYEILDVTGRVVAANNNNTNTARIDVSALKTGVYFVRINGVNGKTVQKIVVQ